MYCTEIYSTKNHQDLKRPVQCSEMCKLAFCCNWLLVSSRSEGWCPLPYHMPAFVLFLYCYSRVMLGWRPAHHCPSFLFFKWWWWFASTALIYFLELVRIVYMVMAQLWLSPVLRYTQRCLSDGVVLSTLPLGMLCVPIIFPFSRNP